MRWILLVAMAVLAGCDSEGGGATPILEGGTTQKGPFIIGSTITIQELGAGLEPTGTSFEVTASDDAGSFPIPSGVTARYVELSADGFYFDEISNTLSAAPITLRSITDTTEGAASTINILTSLAKARIKTLVAGGAAYANARTQAQGELLAPFKITGAPPANFDAMDISQAGDANAMLLATSAVLLQAAHTRNPGAVDAELTSLISSISADVAGDGALDGATIIADLRAAGMAVDLPAVRANLAGRYAALGVAATLPVFEGYVDSDGDGVLPKDTPIVNEGTVGAALHLGTAPLAHDGTVTESAISYYSITRPGVQSFYFWAIPLSGTVNFRVYNTSSWISPSCEINADGTGAIFCGFSGSGSTQYFQVESASAGGARFKLIASETPGP